MCSCQDFKPGAFLHTPDLTGAQSWKRGAQLLKPLSASCKTAQISNTEHFYKAPLPAFRPQRIGVDVQRYRHNCPTPLWRRDRPTVSRTQDQQPGGTGDNFIESNGVRQTTEKRHAGWCGQRGQQELTWCRAGFVSVFHNILKPFPGFLLYVF